MIQTASKPPRMLEALSLNERQIIFKAIQENKAEGLLWLEKLRKFTSFHNRNLRKVSKLRFKEHSADHLSWLREIFLSRIIDHANNLEDSSVINAVLIANDACENSDQYKVKIERILSNLERKLIATAPIPLKEQSNSKIFAYSFKKWASSSLRKIPVTIFCPSPFSLFSITVLQILLYLKIPIKTVVILKFSPGRVKSELYRDGLSLFLKRVWRKLILRSDENTDESQISLKFLKNSLASNTSDIRALARLHNIPCLPVTNFDECLSLEQNPQGEICIFTGGGLIGSKILQYFTLGVINIHMGPLPQYKGMDVVEAPILDGCFNSIALTAHLMEPALDAGPILSEIVFYTDEYKSLGALRNEMGALMPILAIDSIVSILSSESELTPQHSSGQQYYFIHPNLRDIIARVMFQRYESKSLKRSLFLREQKLSFFELIIKDLQLSL